MIMKVRIPFSVAYHEVLPIPAHLQLPILFIIRLYIFNLSSNHCEDQCEGGDVCLGFPQRGEIGVNQMIEKKGLCRLDMKTRYSSRKVLDPRQDMLNFADGCGKYNAAGARTRNRMDCHHAMHRRVLRKVRSTTKSEELMGPVSICCFRSLLFRDSMNEQHSLTLVLNLVSNQEELLS